MSLAVTASQTSSQCLTAMSAADQSALRKSRWVWLSACSACLLGCCIDALCQQGLGGLSFCLHGFFWTAVQLHCCPSVCMACHLEYCPDALLQEVHDGCRSACISCVMGQNVLGDCVDALTQKAGTTACLAPRCTQQVQAVFEPACMA